MPRPTHRLSLYLVPDDPDREVDVPRLEAALDALRGEGVLAGFGPGPRAEALVAGGFRRLRVDRPAQAVLYGNRQGGFYASCPACGAHLAAILGPVLRSWRHGGRREVRGTCGVDSDLARLAYAPPAAIGRFALELRDVGAPELTSEGKPWVEAGIGSFVVVGSRGP